MAKEVRSSRLAAPAFKSILNLGPGTKRVSWCMGKTCVNRPAASVLVCVDLAGGDCRFELGRETRNAAGVCPAGGGGGGRLEAAARPAAPKPAAPTHLHVGHKALLDPPAIFIDLVQELQLIVVAATHGSGKGGLAPDHPEREKPPRCPPAPRRTASQGAGASGSAPGWKMASAEAQNFTQVVFISF